MAYVGDTVLGLEMFTLGNYIEILKGLFYFRSFAKVMRELS